MFKNKKTKIIIPVAFVLIILIIVSLFIGMQHVEKKEFNDKFYRYEDYKPNVKEEGDSVFVDEDGQEIIVKDVDRYSIKDYAFAADKENIAELHKEKGSVVDYLNHEDKYNKVLVTDAEIEDIKKQLTEMGMTNITNDDIDSFISEGRDRQPVSFDGYIEYVEGSDDYRSSRKMEVRTTSYNASILMIYKSEFETEADFATAAYPVFQAIVKKFTKEEIVNALSPLVVNTSTTNLEASIMKGEYDMLFNAVMNGGVALIFRTDTTLVRMDCSHPLNDTLLAISTEIFFNGIPEDY